MLLPRPLSPLCRHHVRSCVGAGRVGRSAHVRAQQRDLLLATSSPSPSPRQETAAASRSSQPPMAHERCGHMQGRTPPCARCPTRPTADGASGPKRPTWSRQFAASPWQTCAIAAASWSSTRAWPRTLRAMLLGSRMAAPRAAHNEKAGSHDSSRQWPAHCSGKRCEAVPWRAGCVDMAKWPMDPCPFGARKLGSSTTHVT